MIAGIGVDIESVDRFRRMAANIRERVVARVLTESEREYCMRYADPWPHVAARFCAKEAFAKSLGVENPRVIPFKDVEVVGRRPQIKARGKALKLLNDKNINKVYLSMSHTYAYAMAVVVLESNP